MEYKKIEKQAYNIHFIKTDKFKKVKVKINFKEETDKEKIVYRNMLSLVLLEATRKYNTRRLLDIQCEYLYNIGIGSSSTMSGNYTILEFDTIFLNEKYTEKGMTEESFKFFLEFIFDPNVIDGMFDEVTFNNSKNILKEDILSYEDSPGRLAFHNLYKAMCPNTPFVYRTTGYLEDLEKITRESLYAYYKELLNSNSVDIFIVGDIDIKKFEKIIDNNFKIDTIKENDKSHFIKLDNYRNEFQILSDKKKVNQSILIFGFKVKDASDFEKKYVQCIYNYILGGSPNSRLFKEVREKNSLCYSISSSYSTIADLEFIVAGIDAKNYDKAVKIIKEEFTKMNNGEFGEKELEEAIVNYLSAFKELEDSIGGILNVYEGHEYLKYDLLDDRRDMIVKVTKDDIINFSKKICPDTIYLLEGDMKNEK